MPGAFRRTIEESRDSREEVRTLYIAVPLGRAQQWRDPTVFIPRSAQRGHESSHKPSREGDKKRVKLQTKNRTKIKFKKKKLSGVTQDISSPGGIVVDRDNRNRGKKPEIV